ncbi:hypothetical protein HCUR_00816 [Holospora curviuscula]|uniref:Uncharacterized protein n=1 Tax=Holospora curviuscula TaxID=1082868 RepID=A0A2S5R902_9PROT|nr:hypothetical protein HCUR_00816 [Holospora curviuscula]
MVYLRYIQHTFLTNFDFFSFLCNRALSWMTHDFLSVPTLLLFTITIFALFFIYYLILYILFFFLV